ncbi:hypothetical protein [Kitasatospora sp. NPDC005856]|uniref:hypothetical protein n=1 Tax=Kitasatospora sp. NPDC005856 TaxID=3154566 RepID=UPI0033CDCFBC
MLGRHGATFHQSVTLRAVVVAGGSISRDVLVRDVTGSPKAREPLVLGVIEELTAAGLMEQDPAEASRLRRMAAGREPYERTTAESAEITARHRPPVRRHSGRGPRRRGPRPGAGHGRANAEQARA